MWQHFSERQPVEGSSSTASWARCWKRWLWMLLAWSKSPFCNYTCWDEKSSLSVLCDYQRKLTMQIYDRINTNSFLQAPMVPPVSCTLAFLHKRKKHTSTFWNLLQKPWLSDFKGPDSDVCSFSLWPHLYTHTCWLTLTGIFSEEL